MMKRLAALLLTTLVATNTAFAHQASDSYLVLTTEGQRVFAQWDIAFRDLNVLLEMDTNGDGSITRGELKSHRSQILDVASRNLILTQGDSKCGFENTTQNPTFLNNDPYLSLNFSVACPNPGEPVRLQYKFLFETDLSHQSLFKLVNNGKETAGIINADNRTLTLNQLSTSVSFTDFFVSGFVHIMDGPDHILFLLVLVIAVTLSAERKHIAKKQICFNTVKLLTAFTVAHAITLGLAQTGILFLPAWLVESAIGLSVAIAAADLFYPFLGAKKWPAAFTFGLIHGLGFASALGPLHIMGTDLVIALTAFNLGIEFGQLVLATTALIILLSLKPQNKIHFFVTRVFATIAFITGLCWFMQRAFGF
ncbi:HupE/UreJ family protein [Kordiimonas aquimaris]|uniref:HupE/UreJ family protein n=1 Tax=Kordiimonas aquimaris TaxID=707591 RepID=UPI0021D35881|nr:HupE/UreJ family protein [Kordiimonas aquimaris]